MDDAKIKELVQQNSQVISLLKQLVSSQVSIFDKYMGRDNPLSVRLVTPAKDRFYTGGGVAVSGGGGGTSDLVQKATRVYEYSVTLTTHATQYTQVLPANVKALIIRERSGTKSFYLSYQALTGSLFRTIEAGQGYTKDNINLASATLYLRTVAAGDAGAVIDIEAWA